MGRKRVATKAAGDGPRTVVEAGCDPLRAPAGKMAEPKRRGRPPKNKTEQDEPKRDASATRGHRDRDLEDGDADSERVHYSEDDTPSAKAWGLIERLDKDMKTAARNLPREDARTLVDFYYAFQRMRIRLSNQEQAGQRGVDRTPQLTVVTLLSQATRLEQNVKLSLDAYSDGSPVGRWARAQKGIGPVLAAGLLAHIELDRMKKPHAVGGIWRFAGLDPTTTWSEGQRRPWNAQLKVLCWKAGDSFVKQSGRPGAMYGQFYRDRKAFELARNDAGENAETARAQLAAKRYGKNPTRTALEAGRLSPGQIDLRARRWAVKLFLSHLHHVMHVHRFGTPPPLPWVVEFGGHAGVIAVPAGGEFDGERFTR
jgi:hypothetical protein